MIASGHASAHARVDLGEILDALAERIAEALAVRLGETHTAVDQWLSTREAAEHLGMHTDTLRRLAGSRAIQAEQDGPGCRLYFRISELDRWRESGGRHSRPAVPKASTRLPPARNAA